MASKGDTTPDGWVTSLTGLLGRLAFEVDGNTVAVLFVDEQRIDVAAGSGSNGGEPRSIVTCLSEDDVHQVLSGMLDPVVAALQGRLLIDGDVLFGMKVLRALRAAPHRGAPAPAGG
jgi:putative sterol carrier protein